MSRFPVVGASSTTATDSPSQRSQQRSRPPNFLFLLVDDIGWGDFGYYNDIMNMSSASITPNIDRWANRPGSVRLLDFHSAGTVCSPTRATVLTGRHHFRDCVDFVYGCPDQRTCPNLADHWEFAPLGTFTVGDAVRTYNAKFPNEPNYTSFFAGKWHLGSFYNDSKYYKDDNENQQQQRQPLQSSRTSSSSPITHGFCHFNATIECARTMTLNCLCQPEWIQHCNFGHYHDGNSSWCSSSSSSTGNAGDCCSNYWWDDPRQPHGVSNLTWPTPDDDALYLVDTFRRFLDNQRIDPSFGEKEDTNSNNATTATTTTTNGYKYRPWLAQISFHNCHIPFVGSKSIKESCAAANETTTTTTTTCRPPLQGQPPYNDEELDYYACLIQLDTAIGNILELLHSTDQYNNTMIWFTSDNGPEHNCPPLGFCNDYDDDTESESTSKSSSLASDQRHHDRHHLAHNRHHLAHNRHHHHGHLHRRYRPKEGPGTTGPLRGRKRDIYEGGHRVPGIISYPALVMDDAIIDDDGDDDQSNHHNHHHYDVWETVYTTDYLPTIMELLHVDRPTSQQQWAIDGRSIVSLLQDPTHFQWNDTPDGVRSTGIAYHDTNLSITNGWGYRHGKWKMVYGSASCTVAECQDKPQLFDLETDIGEQHDVSKLFPHILNDLLDKFQQWHNSIIKSRRDESNCTHVTHLDLPLPDRLATAVGDSQQQQQQ